MDVRTKLANLGGRRLLKVQKHSPEILTAVGVVGGVVAAVMACRATVQSLPLREEHAGTVDELKTSMQEGGYEDAKSYSKDLAFVHTTFALKVAKLYAPSVSLALGSIGSIVAAQGIMHKRQAGLVAAYAVLDRTFAEYRDRVQHEIGEEREGLLKQGIKKVDTKEDKDGDIVTKVTAQDPNQVSSYARFFDETNKNWVGRSQDNFFFLKAQQNYMNDLLQSRGHLFLNEVYDVLGIERSQAGQVVGWVIGHGDPFVDFGIFDTHRESARYFVNGHEASVLLDFNVAGTILDKI